MSEQNTPIVYKGLAGVIADESAVSKVMPETNSLTYRGYAVQELCAKKDFIEVAFLLFYGHLPTEQEKKAFDQQERKMRVLPEPVLKCIKEQISSKAHPMDVVRTCISLLACVYPEKAIISQKQAAGVLEHGVALFAQIPTIIASFFRIKQGKQVIAPDENLNYTDNFFMMCFGEKPDATTRQVFDISMILYAEHGLNASTFTARAITSTESDIYGAVVGAIAALKGPLHGGANEAVMHMMLEIGTASKAKQWLSDALAQKRKVMGFGHRVYRTGDSRVPTMQAAFFQLAQQKGQTEWCDIYQALFDEMLTTKNIYPNLDFPAGPAYYLMGFDIDFFTPLFVMSRITGWTAHIVEQVSSNKLIRPSSLYVGPEQRPVV